MKKQVIIVCSLAAALLAVGFANWGIRTTRPATLRRLIEQNIQIGSTPEQVIRFLDTQHLDHTDLTSIDKYHNLRKSPGDVMMMGAIKRRTWQSLLEFESIQIVFVFDSNDRLVRFDFIQVYTGL